MFMIIRRWLIDQHVFAQRDFVTRWDFVARRDFVVRRDFVAWRRNHFDDFYYNVNSISKLN
jgi:hypothetical protein